MRSTGLPAGLVADPLLDPPTIDLTIGDVFADDLIALHAVDIDPVLFRRRVLLE